MTQQKYTDRAHEFLDSIANTSDGVYAVDGDHRIILWNGAAEAILGFTAAEVLGKPCYEMVSGRDGAGNVLCNAACADLRLAEHQQLVPTRDVLSKTKDGRDVWINVTNIPIPSGANDHFALIHIFRDVSEAKHLERFGERLASLVNDLPRSRMAEPRQRRVESPSITVLTQREREVLRLLASGANASAVAATLSVSLSTARKHIQNILTKLNVHSALQAVARANEDDLL